MAFVFAKKINEYRKEMQSDVPATMLIPPSVKTGLPVRPEHVGNAYRGGVRSRNQVGAAHIATIGWPWPAPCPIDGR